MKIQNYQGSNGVIATILTLLPSISVYENQIAPFSPLTPPDPVADERRTKNYPIQLEVKTRTQQIIVKSSRARRRIGEKSFSSQWPGGGGDHSRIRIP